MRLVVTRVTSASVSVAGEQISAIKKGLLVLVAVARDGDDSQVVGSLAKKLTSLRVWDELKSSVKDVEGQVSAAAPGMSFF